MRTLGLIAIGGLGIGIASLSLAYALGGRDLHRLPFHVQRRPERKVARLVALLHQAAGDAYRGAALDVRYIVARPP